MKPTKGKLFTLFMGLLILMVVIKSSTAMIALVVVCLLVYMSTGLRADLSRWKKKIKRHIHNIFN